MKERSWNFRKIGISWLWYLIVPAGIVAHFFYLYRLTGDAFAFFTAQSAWGRSIDWLSDFAHYLDPLFSRHNRIAVIDLIMTLASLLLGILMLLRGKHKEYGAYSLICVLALIATGNLYSMMRYTMGIFSVWIYLADLMRNREKWLYYICAALASAQVLLCCGWVNYYWIA